MFFIILISYGAVYSFFSFFRLLDDANQLRTREGQNLNKELIGLGALLRTLSDPTQVS